MKDLIIVGGSIAATAAGIYAARRKLDFEIITQEFGGEVATSGEIGNWPGIISINGLELSDQFRKHLEALNVQITEGLCVSKVEKVDDHFVVHVQNMSIGTAAEKGKMAETNGTTYEAKTVLLATGVHPRHLEIPGEKEFFQKGVTYCTTCDGPIFSDKTVATIGSGNSGAESVIMLAGIAKKVYWVIRKDAVKADPILVEKIKNFENVEIIYNAAAKAVKGEAFVTELEYEDASNGEARSLPLDGLFVHIGMIPNSGMVTEEVHKNKTGEIVVDKVGQTSVPGLFAAGDVTDIPYNQIAIAAGHGVSALLQIVNYLNKQEG